MKERIVCTACGGVIAPVEQQPLVAAVEVHSTTCPAVLRKVVKS